MEPNRFTEMDCILAIECIMSSANVSREVALGVINDLQRNAFKVERNSNG